MLIFTQLTSTPHLQIFMAKNERRDQERFSLQLKVKFSTKSDIEEKKTKQETIAANISSGGILLVTRQQLPLASKVYLEFLIGIDDLKKLRFILSLDRLKSISGKKTWVKATGIVIRCDEKGLGIIFDQDYQLSPLEGPEEE